jgi:hypothetical protein
VNVAPGHLDDHDGIVRQPDDRRLTAAFQVGAASLDRDEGRRR